MSTVFFFFLIESSELDHYIELKPTTLNKRNIGLPFSMTLNSFKQYTSDKLNINNKYLVLDWINLDKFKLYPHVRICFIAISQIY